MFVSESEYDKITEMIVQKEDFIISECYYDNDYDDELIPRFLGDNY